MRVEFRGFKVVITEVTTAIGTYWYSAFYYKNNDGDRSLPPCDTYVEAVLQARYAVANYLGVEEVVGR